VALDVNLRFTETQRNPLLTRLATIVVFLVSLLAGSSATAQDLEVVATVEVISAMDARDRWVKVNASPDAVRIRGADEVALEKGMTLVAGDRVRTGLARVQLELDAREHMNISEHALVTLHSERRVLQYLGEVYYRLRGAFSVKYGPVETTVEGTKFVVGGTVEDVEVMVSEGRVKVQSGEEAVRVVGGQRVKAADKKVTKPQEWRRRDRTHQMSRMHPTDPEFDLGLAFAPQLRLAESGGLSAAGRLRTRVEFMPYLGLGADIGIRNNLADGGIRVPMTAGPEVRIGRVVLGGRYVVEYEGTDFGGLGQRIAWHFGGAVMGRFRWVDFGPLSVESEVRLGVVDTPRAEITIGLGMKL
jgi:hypothetical protein